MNKRIAKRWIENLTNGKYKQARDQLCKTDNKGNKTYCCLGVLTDMYLKTKVARADKIKFNFEQGRLNGDLGNLSQAVMEWAEMNDTCGTYGKEQQDLADKNDRGCSFKQIAGIIEREVDNL